MMSQFFWWKTDAKLEHAQRGGTLEAGAVLLMPLAAVNGLGCMCRMHFVAVKVVESVRIWLLCYFLCSSSAWLGGTAVSYLLNLRRPVGYLFSLRPL